MTVWHEGENSFHFGARAELLPDDREIAGHWASPHVIANPANAYILGRYAESGRANSNRQLFSLDGLQMGRPSLQHAPLNVNHAQRRVVGAFVASDIVYPTGEEIEAAAVSDTELNPFMESLAVMWKHYFADDYRVVQMAQSEGALYFSMEAVPEKIACAGNGGCGEEYAYEGPKSTKYCAHLNECASDKHLINPHFIGGALIIPPIKPGWANANIKTVNLAANEQKQEAVYAQMANEFDHLEPAQWDSLMRQVLALAEDPTN